MSSLKRILVNGGLFALLVVLLISFIAKSMDFPTLVSTLKSVDIKYIFIAILAMFVFLCCDAANIGRAYKVLGTPIKTLDKIKYSCVGFFFSAITPSASGGQPMQAIYMVGNGISPAKSFLSLILSFICYQTAMVTYGVVGYILIGKKLFTGNIYIHILFIIGLIINILMLVFMLLTIFKKNVVLAIGRFIKMCIKFFSEAVAEKFETMFLNMVDEYNEGALYIIKHTGALVKAMLTAFMQPLMMGIITCMVYLAMGFNSVPLWEVFFIQCMINLSVSTLPVPGAVGASEGVFYFLFKEVFSEDKVPYALLLTRSINFYLFVFITGIVSAIAYIAIRRKRILAKNIKEDKILEQ